MATGSSKERLPGKFKKDYTFMKFQGRVYAVYKVKIGGGKTIKMSWRVNKSDLQFFKVDRKNIRQVTKGEFDSVQYFGNASEIVTPEGQDVHPFRKYVTNLQERVGPVRWLSDPEVMGVMLMGWAEGWAEADIATRLQRTKFYQSQTLWERQWKDGSLSSAEKNNTIERVRGALVEAIEDDIYGAGFDWRSQISEKRINELANQIASGKWGNPDEGVDFWRHMETQKAQDIEGTLAWAQQQQAGAEQRGFANKPEDEFQRIKTLAQQWLGPGYAPPDDQLRKWANDLITEVASDADFEQFLQKRAKELHPWISPNEKWEDRAGVYKGLIERELGTSIGYDDPLLRNLGAADENGVPTGAIQTLDQFQLNLRKQDRWWGGKTARDESFGILAELDTMMNG